jgi:glycosyltransferase involved in cell wall biosynthesis
MIKTNNTNSSLWNQKKHHFFGKKIFFVIPAYNEGEKIRHVVLDLQKTGYKNIVVIDDGSKDNTYDSCQGLKIHTLKHIINRGQGAALKTGIDFALLHGADAIVTFDSDGQHRVEDLPAMLKPVLNGEVDVTLGSRFLKKTNLPFTRKILLKGAVLIQWVFYGVKLSDAHNGYRVLSRSAAEKIHISADRMEHASEIVEEIIKKKISFKEVPVIIRYTDYSVKKGHGSYLGALRIFFKMIMKKFME